MRFQGLLFDLDGTLVDSHAEICSALARALSDLSLGVSQARVQQLVDGSSLEHIWDQLCADAATKPAADVDFGRFARSYREHYMRDIGYASALFPGALDLLRRVRAMPERPHCAVVSNKTSASVTPLLDRLGISGFFDLALGCGGTAIPAKPAPDLLLSALQQLQCPAERCAMIGDTTMDVLAGKRAGMFTIALSHGMCARDALVEAGADYLCDDFSQVAELLLAT